MKKLRIAIVGCKNMGQKHLRCLRNNFSDEVRVVGILNSTPESTMKVALEFDVSPLESISFITRRNIDAVIVATPLEHHYDIAKMLLKKKIPLLVEKPFAETEDQCYELAQLAKEKNVPLLIGHTENYNPAVVMLKQKLEGKIKSVAAIRTSNNPGVKKTHIISELMIHDLAIVQSLIDDDWNEIRVNKDDRYRWDEHAIVEMKHNAGTIVRLEALRHQDAELKRQMRIIDYKNNIWQINFMERKLIKNDQVLCSGGDSLKNELRNFVDILQCKSKLQVEIEEACQVVNLCNKLEIINKNQ
ncbi:MAG: Gfo/Idh/MocA family oxidoreductase [Alphaproteobacteria bacterium]|nr:Gfo/Idh/MocA family oxidoreductase [Alphaproteobacteria bacterium]